ncbi:MAG TPA: GDP-mannose 4,6-dehydratase [Microthrixaceae bacterium]|jgi:GDP-4-dehydro-6-deoxy-D-mannose reductase|nr:GDP-mannose 4,6-dehydratase [Microthrixaceae bacterium]
MKVLITGAGGFVGHHLATHLHEAGDEVMTTDRSTDGLDITDAPAMLEAFRRRQPEVVYHLAGASDVGGSWSTPQATFRSNAEGTLNVLWAAREAGVERVLTVGSADVYGKVSAADLPISEQLAMRPVSPYAASKASADHVALQANLGFGQHVIRARPFNHLGPGQSNRFVAAALAERVASNELSGESKVTVGNLSPRRDFTDVRDVVRAYRLLVEHGAAGEVYNVCSGRAIAVQALADEFISLASIPMELVTDPDLERPVDIPVLLGDNARIRADTGWEPQIPLATTLRDLLDDQRRRVRS